MINSNELRIGNWFSIRLIGIEDTGTAIQCNANHLVDLSEMKGAFLSKKCYDPIPLTPEILEKAGFVNVRDVHWCVPKNDPSKSFEICVWSDHISFTRENFFHVELKSLHQLQNLYFALTGTELEINL